MEKKDSLLKIKISFNEIEEQTTQLSNEKRQKDKTTICK
jgi:hypothetical protein